MMPTLALIAALAQAHAELTTQMRWRTEPYPTTPGAYYVLAPLPRKYPDRLPEGDPMFRQQPRWP